jgi:hypothetical protein
MNVKLELRDFSGNIRFEFSGIVFLQCTAKFKVKMIKYEELFGGLIKISELDGDI